MNKSGEGGESRSQVTQDNVPGGDVKLEGEDDVSSVAYLTNEAALSAQVAVEHVVGGILRQGDQVGSVFALCYLKNTKHTHIKMFEGGRRLVQLHHEHGRIPVAGP